MGAGRPRLWSGLFAIFEHEGVTWVVTRSEFFRRGFDALTTWPWSDLDYLEYDAIEHNAIGRLPRAIASGCLRLCG